MRRFIPALVWLALTGACATADFDPFAGPKPLAVFIHSTPWEAHIGSDRPVVGVKTPRVAIYENGEVIFAKKVNNNLIYHRVLLDNEELQKVRERIKPVLGLTNVKPQYSLFFGADASEAMFYLTDGDRAVTTGVYGLEEGLASERRKSADRKSLGRGQRLDEGRSKPSPNPYAPPDGLLELHQWLRQLDYPNSDEWKPKYVEVVLRDYPYEFNNASIPWPKELLSLNSTRTVKHGSTYSIFLDGSSLPKLRRFLTEHREKGAITEIQGKKMEIGYKHAFPAEREWRNAFEAAARERYGQKASGQTE